MLLILKNGGSRTSESNRIIYCKTGSMIQQFLDEEEIEYITDDISPVIKKVTQQEKNIIIQADDAGVGLHEKAYSLDGVNWFSNNSLTVKKSGYYAVYVRDMLGNIAVEENVEVKIKEENSHEGNESETDATNKDKEGNIAKKLVVIEPEENGNKSDSKNNNGSTNKNDNKATTNTNNEEDKTVTPAKKLPQTGVNLLIPITLITIAGIVAISYKKFKSIKLK